MSNKKMNDDNNLLPESDNIDSIISNIEEYIPDDIEYSEEEFDEDDSQDYGDDYEDYVIPKKKKKKKNPKRIMSIKISASLIILSIIIGISIVLSVSIIYLGKEFMGIDKSSKIYILEIEEGSTTDDIADMLYENKIIRIPQLFKLFTRIQGKDAAFTAGEHQVQPNMDYSAMIEELTTPVSKLREYTTVTFPEGTNVSKAASLLEDAGICEAKQFIYFFNTGCDMGDFTFAQSLPAVSDLQFYAREGYLFPDTYEFYLEEDPEIVCIKIFRNFDDKFLPEYYDRMKELGMNINEVVTLASMIQAEAGNVQDMPKISSVFHNRLNNPDTYPKLQSDPTKKYVEEVIEPNEKMPDSNMKLAYDTYESAGLPPGAICNPGADAIHAALYPETTPYYFFIANVDTRTTYFAETYEQHLENEAMVKQQYKDAEAALAAAQE